jgi:3-hydroxymyristoyl/3-hydroxydecanoyl-(acyl carrier protein) dehydratase
MEEVDICRLAGQRYSKPIRAIDQIVQLDERKIVTRKAVAVNEPFFVGHLPECPVLPGVFTLETVLQAVRYWVSPRKVRLDKVKRVRYWMPVFPGDVIECTAFCTPQDNRLEVTASCNTARGEAASFKLLLLIEEE